MKTLERIETIKKEGYDIDFGTIFNEAFENYKKIALQGAVAFILIGLVFGMIYLALFFMIFATPGDFTAESMANFSIANFSTSGIVAYWFGMILFSGLVSPVSAGLIKMAQSAAKQENISIGSVFQYYGNAYFKDLFLSTVCIAVVSSTLSVASEIIGYKIFLLLLTVVLGFMTFLTIPLIIFGNLKALEAIKGSIIIVSKQPLILLGLLIVSWLFAFLGFIGLCIGIFFTIPFIYSMYYCIYASIVGDENKDEEIEDAPIEIEA